MDYELDEAPAEVRRSVVWVGDNRRKDVALGKRLGVFTAWAEYGIASASDVLLLAEFSPLINIEKNAEITAQAPNGPRPDVTLKSFSEILQYIPPA